MKILFASSEVVPFAKTGGLADVSGALPVQLEKLGHDVAVFMPAYQSVMNSGFALTECDVTFQIAMGQNPVEGRLFRSKLPNSNVDVYFVDQPNFFDRPGLYGDSDGDYRDNSERFIFFCRAIIEAIQSLDYWPDVIHCNDWQTGLIPAYLKTDYSDERYKSIASLLTIHNLAYQGSFWHWDMSLTGMDWQYFNWQELEFYGRLNFLKAGIVFADAISTVSERYAAEIQGPDLGCGIEGVLQSRASDLFGILNGIDATEWNPATDQHLVRQYGVDDWGQGKAACKAAIQQALGLPQTDAPLIGLVGRLASQKGWSVILPVMKHWLEEFDVQWVILGAGDQQYEGALAQLANQYPEKLGLKTGFSNALAHQIEAGADIFLMPSQYEPCGLNQMYSLTYGTIPVVHETGGLADTVINLTPESLAGKRANGFSFVVYSPQALESTLYLAVTTMQQKPQTWNQLVTTGMKQDWSWSISANKYQKLYELLVRQKQLTSSAG